MMTIEEIGRKMDALGIWDVVQPCHWALKLRGCAIPYFCCTMKGDGNPVKVRFLLLEGWQTFHDFVRTRIDPNFGFYSMPAELPHFELLILQTGEMRLFRHDPGYVPRLADSRERDLCARMLWEAYGVLLRLETDRNLPLKFAGEQAVFARLENADGTWRDEPIAIPTPRPHVERVTFPKKALAEAKDLPIHSDEAWELDLRLVPGLMVREARPRSLYVLAAAKAATGEIVFCDKLSVDPETGLRGLWESLGPRVLGHFVERRSVPGELRVMTGRAFRLIRPLCLELSFRLSKVTELPHFQSALQNLV